MTSQATTATPAPSKARSRTNLLVVITVIIIVLIILLVPIALAGGFNVPVGKVSFNSITGSLGYANVQATTNVVTAIEYYYSIRLGGIVHTNDANVSSNNGTTNMTITMKLITPSNQTIDLGQTTIQGGIGTRTHTVYPLTKESTHQAPTCCK